MKKQLLILLCVPLIGFGQQMTYVPDDNFEEHLEFLNLGNGIPNDDSVLTSNINTITNFFVIDKNIVDLTGIEDFSALTVLNCSKNQHTSLDVSNNTNLTWLYCDSNQITSLDVSSNLLLEHLNCFSNKLTSLDVSNNIFLEYLNCFYNELTSLDVSYCPSLDWLYCGNNQLTSLNITNNTSLTHLVCPFNQITSLDVSNHPDLERIFCHNNQLSYLNLKNGNNTSIPINNVSNCLSIINNPFLYCIEVDNVSFSNNNWFGAIDAQHYFSTNCPPLSLIKEQTKNKELLKVTDISGREVNEKRNTPLFYIYNDGTVEKKMIIE